MLNEKQLNEIKEHLEKSQNPLFFFDNDVDGLASFLVLRRYIDRGKGVAIKSFPELNVSYTRKIRELKPDYVFILDKPIVSKDFITDTLELGLPIVWIDHHELDDKERIKTSEKEDVARVEDFENLHYYNSAYKNDKSSEPTTYWCYKVSKREEDNWLALLGCIGDGYLPEFIDEVKKKYPDLMDNCETAFSCLYNTKLGEITKMLSFGLKDRTTNVVKMIKFLYNVKSPYEILEENGRNFTVHRRYEQIERKYQKLMEKAKTNNRGNLVYFQYGGDLSISADIANELHHLNPGKVIVVAYIKGAKANISLRGSNVREITAKAISELDNASGGGHKDATGAQVYVEDLPKFKEKIEEIVDS